MAKHAARPIFAPAAAAVELAGCAAADVVECRATAEQAALLLVTLLWTCWRRVVGGARLQRGRLIRGPRRGRRWGWERRWVRAPSTLWPGLVLQLVLLLLMLLLLLLLMLRSRGLGSRSPKTQAHARRAEVVLCPPHGIIGALLQTRVALLLVRGTLLMALLSGIALLWEAPRLLLTLMAGVALVGKANGLR